MVIAAGQKLRASEINDIIPIFGLVASDVTRTSSTVLTNITGMSAAVEANSTYALDAYLAYTAGATGDLKVSITVPASATGSWGLYPIAVASTGSIGDLDGRRIDAFGDVNFQSGGGSDALSGALMCLPRGVIVTAGTAGTVQFRFAQNTSSATSTIIEAGSWLRLSKIA